MPAFFKQTTRSSLIWSSRARPIWRSLTLARLTQAARPPRGRRRRAAGAVDDHLRAAELCRRAALNPPARQEQSLDPFSRDRLGGPQAVQKRAQNATDSASNIQRLCSSSRRFIRRIPREFSLSLSLSLSLYLSISREREREPSRALSLSLETRPRFLLKGRHLSRLRAGRGGRV